MKPTHVRLQNCYTQTGITGNPVMAWNYAPSDAGRRQLTYRILLKTNHHICFDSGTVRSSRQNNITIRPQLQSHMRYTILVEVTDSSGERQWSDPVFFITGICAPEDWHAQWISNQTAKPFYAGKRVFLRDDIQEAYLSGCGLGQFILTLNGSRACPYELEGVWTDFNKRVLYSTYDVTSMLSAGKNDIVMEVANGWYIGDTSEERHFYTMGKGYKPYGDCLPCILRLTVRFVDGGEEVIGTDESWWTHRSPTTLANIYGSEDYDARLALNWTELYEANHEMAFALSPKETPQGAMLPMLHPPVAVKETYNTVSVRRTACNGLLYDFGQNMSGLFEITVRGNPGQSIKMNVVEKLDMDGQPLPTINAYSRYILRGNGVETWRPRFTYQAGRYLHVEGVAEKEGDHRLPVILDAHAYFITTSASDTGNFACSDNRLMQIHDLILRASESNLNHVHSDCPTVERLGWLEPNHLMGPSVMFMKDVDTLWTKIAADMRDAQYGPDERDVDSGACGICWQLF